MNAIQLKGYYLLEGTIRCETGLHIGGSSERIEIGGVDNPVIKHPQDEFPYIPGSSLKGKMRSLLEWKEMAYRMQQQAGHDIGEVHPWCGDANCKICRLFGIAADDAEPAKTPGPGRLIIRDAMLTEASKDQLRLLKKSKGIPYVEEKFENTINRLTARANPRQMERVPAGIEFGFELSFRCFQRQNDDFSPSDDQLFQTTLRECLQMVEWDTLGGSGSRGYGQITFEFDGLTWIDLNQPTPKLYDPHQWWDEKTLCELTTSDS